MGGGTAEVAVIHKERSGQAQQRLNRQKCDLPTRRNRRSLSELAELRPRLTDSQVQEIGKLSHTARLLLGKVPRKGSETPQVGLRSGANGSPLPEGSVRFTHWEELGAPVRLAIEARTGPVRAVRTVSEGRSSQLAVVLHTDAGAVFVKGLPRDHPGAIRQEREAMINPHVRSVAPQLL